MAYNETTTEDDEEDPLKRDRRIAVLAPKHSEEANRLAALRRYEILDTEFEAAFDRLTQLAAELLDIPISLISLVDENRQWFKAQTGVEMRETPLNASVCAHAMLETDASSVFVVPELRDDERFADNPLVTGEPHIRFYAGAPLITPDGYPMGMFCVLDNKPHEFTDRQKEVLRILAREAMAQINLRVQSREQTRLINELAIRTEVAAFAHQQELKRLNAIFEQTPGFLATLRGPEHTFEFSNPAYQRLVGNRDIIGKPVREAIPELAEQGLVTLLDEVYQSGKAFIGRDIPILLAVEPGSEPVQRYLDFVYQPFLDEQGKVTGIIVHGIDLTDRKSLEQERERLLAETRLLSEIGRMVSDGALSPDEVQFRAVTMLGKLLKLDRCYFYQFDPRSALIHVGRDWHRADLPTLAGTYPQSLLNDTYTEMYGKGGSTVVYNDTEQEIQNPEVKALLARHQVRALLGVSFRNTDGVIVAALRAAYSDTAYIWTPSDIALVESVATLVRSAVESARVLERGHKIAEQLQKALIPAQPPQLPGLSLAGHYQPALDEATVGGDFWDVFSLDDNRSALVVGDLSGKGLAAASQVATVRNMLRYVLYTSPSIAEAVKNLNQVIAGQNLLTGFATLFVGIYDPSKKTLNYVNCGQEPGLLYRTASKNIDRLPPTAPILGGFAFDSGFTEQTVPLNPGDVIAIFTDGLTEVGPTRAQFLEIEGVCDYFKNGIDAGNKETAAGFTASTIANGLIRNIDEYAQGGARDDIALLVGIVQ